MVIGHGYAGAEPLGCLEYCWTSVRDLFFFSLFISTSPCCMKLCVEN